MKWSDKQDYSGALDRCACCGKKLLGKSLWVEVINGGELVVAPGQATDTSDPGYMGFYPVGTTCGRQHFLGFTHNDIKG